MPKSGHVDIGRRGLNMKNGTLIYAAVALAATSLATPALAEWRGTAKAVSATPQCAAGGTVTAGSYFNARFNPPLLFGQPNATRYRFFDKYWAFGIRASGALGAALEPVEFGGVGYTIPTGRTGRTVSQTPAVIAATTPQVTTRILINNFDEVAGCTVVFDFSGFLR
jgi:hypothetical protein